VTAATLFGVGGSLAQFLFQRRGVNVDWLVTMRLLSAGIVLLSIATVRQGRKIFAVWHHDAASLILFGLLGMLGVQYTYMAAINASNSATATLLQFTAPAMIAVWLGLSRRRLPKAHELAAIALAMLGTFFLVTHGQMGRLSISLATLLWGLAAAAAAAFNSLQPVRLLREHGTTLVGGWGMLVGGLALCLLHAPWKVQGLWDGRAYAFLVFILLLGTLIAFYLYITALRLIGAQTSSLLTCAEPLAAAVLAVWWLGAGWSSTDWLGAALILLTIALLAKSQHTQTEKLT
jgi:drug/metabolite transporter (DMT)-like permease